MAKKAVTVVVDEKVIFTDLLSDDIERFIKECDDAIDFTYRVTSWGWKCSGSPVGMCMYDLVEDRAKDSCLFCGQPEERK